MTYFLYAGLIPFLLMRHSMMAEDNIVNKPTTVELAVFDRKLETIKFLKQPGVEGDKRVSYLDQDKKWTIGAGTRVYPNGRTVKPGDTCTEDQVNEYAGFFLERRVFPVIDKYYYVPPRVYVALSSLYYNVGYIGDELKDAIEAKDWQQLAHAFRLYIFCNGVKNQGLINRREIEISYFLTPATTI